MKKIIKWLLPILVIALLMGTLAFTVSAEDTAINDKVALYRNGAVVSGNEQVTYATAVNNAQAGDTIKLLGNVSVSDVVQVSKAITIDIGPFTLDFSGWYANGKYTHIFVPGNNKISIKGTGKIIASSYANISLVATGNGATCTVEFLGDANDHLEIVLAENSNAFDHRGGNLNFTNVDFNVSGFHTMALRLLHTGICTFRDSTININSTTGAYPFELRNNKSTDTGNRVLNIINTDINVTNLNSAHLFLCGKNSTVNIEDSLIDVKDDTSLVVGNNDGNGVFNVETGVAMTKSAWDTKSSSVTVNAPTVYTYEDKTLYVKRGAYYSDSGLNNEVASTAENANYYGYKNSKCLWAAFSGEPSATNVVTADTFSNEIFSAVKAENIGGSYIQAYAPVTFSGAGTNATPIERTLTVDLNGNTLTLTGTDSNNGFNPNDSVVFTLKNGTVESNKARLLFPTNTNTNIIFENLTCNWTAQVFADYRSGGTFTAKDCTFNFNGYSGGNQHCLALFNGGGDSKTLDMSFVDCTVNMASSAKFENGFVSLSSNVKSQTLNVNVAVKGCNFNLNSNGSVVFANRSSTATFNLNVDNNELESKVGSSSFASAVPYFLIAGTNSASAVTLANGVVFNRFLDANTAVNVDLDNIYPDGSACVCRNDATLPYVVTNVTDDIITVSFVKGDTATNRYYFPDATETLNYSDRFNTVDVAGKEKVQGHRNGWFDQDEKLITLLVPEDGMVIYYIENVDLGYADWAIFDAANVITYNSIKNGEALPGNTNDLIGKNGTLRLYKSMTYSFTTNNKSVPLPDGSTIDLNGFTLSMKNFRFLLRGTEGEGYTIKNGTLDATPYGNNVLFSDIGNLGYVNFENVIFNLLDTKPAVDIRGGTVNITDCTYTAKKSGNNFFLYLGAKTGSKNHFVSITVNGGSYTANEFIRVAGSTDATYLLDLDVTVTGNTVIDCNYLVNHGGKYDSASTVDIVFGGNVTVTSSQNQPVYSSVDTKFTLTFEEGFRSNNNPTAIKGTCPPDTLTIPKGCRVVETTGAYKFEVKKINLPVEGSLTLYSDFNINLFLPANVTAVKLGDVKLELETLKDGSKWTVLNGISPDKAADTITLRIGFIEGNIGYSVVFECSVIRYAEKLLSLTDAESVAAKPVVASIVRYIAAAYTYKGYTVPADLAALMESDNYKNNLPALAKDVNGDKDVDGLIGAIDSASLALSSECYYHLKLVEGFNGTLTVNGKKYEIVDGKYEDNNYVDVKVHASKFNAGLTITAVADDQTYYSGTYTLADYIDFAEETENAKLIALTYALYTYAQQASEYLGK